MPRVALVGDGHGGSEDYATLVLWWASEGAINYGSQIEALCLGDVGGNTTFSGNPPFGAVIHTDSILYDGSNQSSLAICTGSITINGNDITVSDVLINGLAGVLGNNALLTRSRVLGGINYNSSGTAGKLVSFCVISRSSSFVITYGGGDQGDVENCLIFGTTGTGIITGGGGGQNLKNNFSFNNGGNDYQGATDSFVTNASEDLTGTSGLTGFTSAELVNFAGNDFRAKSTSTLATAGTTTPYVGAFLETSQGVTVTVDSGVYSQAGTNTLLKSEFNIKPNTSSYLQSGDSLNLKAQLSITTTSGSYLLTGLLVNLRVAKRLIVNTGSYNLTGTDVTLIYTPGGGGEILIIDTGIYSLGGNEVLLKADLSIANGIGNYSVSGTPTLIRYDASITLLSGSYISVGEQLNTFANYGMIAVSNSYTLTGVSVTLKYSGDTNQIIGTVTAGFAPDLYSAGYKPTTITVTFKE